jgi:hypothetical protein
VNARLDRPCLVLAWLATAPDGEAAHSVIKYFVHHLPDRDAMFAEIVRREIPMRYRIAVFWLSSMLFGNDRPIVWL